MAESPEAVLEPIGYKYPHANLNHRSKATNMLIGISVTLTILLVLGVIVYCYVKGRQQRRRQQQQHEIHFVQMTAALPRRVYHSAGDTDECSICLEEYQDEEDLVDLPGCHHLFHPQCIESALRVKQECPVCRAQLEG